MLLLQVKVIVVEMDLPLELGVSALEACGPRKKWWTIFFYIPWNVISIEKTPNFNAQSTTLILDGEWFQVSTKTLLGPMCDDALLLRISDTVFLIISDTVYLTISDTVFLRYSEHITEYFNFLCVWSWLMLQCRCSE